MQTLNRSYRALEDVAGNYADADRAWGEARRRRSARRRGLVGALAAVLLVGSLIAPFRLVEGRQVATPADPGAIPTVSPPTSAPRLPTDAPVAAGVMVYTACMSGCPTFLVTRDGSQYLLGQQTVAPPGNFTLSPDGRWLGQPDAQGYTVRQLDGTAVVRLPPSAVDAGLRTSPWAWSPDSRTLLVGTHRDGVVRRWTEFALSRAAVPEGAVSVAAVPQGYAPAGITGAGTSVLLPDDAYRTTSNRLRLVVDGAGRELTLVAPGTGVFADSEHGPWVRVPADRVLALVYAGDTTQVATYTMSGELLQQAELARTEGPVGVDQGELVVMNTPDSGEPATLVRVTGEQRVRLAEVPAQALVVLPGGVRG